MRILLHVSLFIQRGDSVLLVQEADPEDGGCWNLPGGSVEPKEAISAGGIREAHEETGLIVTLRDLVGVYSRTGTLQKRAVRFVYRADTDMSEAVAGDGVLAVRWFTRDELAQFPDQQFLNPAQLRAIFADGFAGTAYPSDFLREQ